MIEIVNGDLLQSNLPLIAHQTNCLGVMGAGIAKAIKINGIAYIHDMPIIVNILNILKNY